MSVSLVYLGKGGGGGEGGLGCFGKPAVEVKDKVPWEKVLPSSYHTSMCSPVRFSDRLGLKWGSTFCLMSLKKVWFTRRID